MKNNEFLNELEEFQQYEKRIEKMKEDCIIAQTNLENERLKYKDLIKQVEDRGINLKDLPKKIEELRVEITQTNAKLKEILQ